MSNVRKFEFKKTYKEIDINGELYRIEFNDDAIKKQVRVFTGFQKKYKNFEEIETEDLSEEQFEKLQIEQKEAMKEVIEVFLGDETFEVLYTAAGRSLLNLMDLVYYLISLTEEHQEERFNDKKSKYIKQKK